MSAGETSRDAGQGAALSGTRGMARVELLAYPAGHSLSPAMHNAAFGHLGLAACYRPREVPPEGLVAAVEGLRGDDVLGANVTIPHKERVMPLLDELSERAAAIGAVNTIVRRGRRLVGHNTDSEGFLRALAQLGFAVDGCSALLLGAGGAARAVAHALLSSGARRVLVYNRTEARAVRLATDFAGLGPIEAVGDNGLRAAAGDAELLVNATSVGMAVSGQGSGESAGGGAADSDSPLPAGYFPSGAVAVDIVYRPQLTRFLREAQEAGLVWQNGLPMLVHQGAEAFELWTGREAPTEIMEQAARSELGA